jgi:hypothetical protein
MIILIIIKLNIAIPLGKYWDSNLIWPRPLPFKSLPIHHLSITLHSALNSRKITHDNNNNNKKKKKKKKKTIASNIGQILSSGNALD